LAQPFGKNSNWISRTLLLGIIGLALASWAVASIVDQSNYVTGVGYFREQPIPFSHQHHVSELKIDCRYCHTQVETGAYAALPPVEICMTCHAQIWNMTPTLKLVRDSYDSNKPILWSKVTQIPHFAYFDHSIHVSKGIGCFSCHGDVSTMPLTALAHPIQMQFCVDCHRHPEKYVRPRAEVFNLHYVPTISQEELGAQLVRAYHIKSKTDCYTCHR
jgi:hypothetical protein